MVSRRDWLRAAAAAAVAGMVGTAPVTAVDAADAAADPIDRRAVVGRHNVVRTRSRRGSPLQVGNGRFAFGADVTGLQTFVPFNTLSDWGWYAAPLPPGRTIDELAWPDWLSHGRQVPYDTGDPAHPQLTAWAFANPSRINLGRIGLTLRRADGTAAAESDLADVRQELDLWTGTLTSRFTLDGAAVTVRTACHPEVDAIAAVVTSPLVASGSVTAFVDFPLPDGRQFADHVGTFDHPAGHATTAARRPSGRVDVVHDLGHAGQRVCAAIVPSDGTAVDGPGGTTRPATLTIDHARFGADGQWMDVTDALAKAASGCRLTTVVNNETFGRDPAHGHVKRLEVAYTVDGEHRQATVTENGTLSIGPPDATHRLSLRGNPGGDSLSFTVTFSPTPAGDEVPDAAATLAAASRHWPAFWRSGGAIDLSASADPRWRELERRIVLSQYLMAVNEAGDLPPQESGLVNTGWFGKFHMEMYWWHAAHHALWDRWPALDRSSGVYGRFLASSVARAKRQGLRRGAVDEDGRAGRPQQPVHHQRDAGLAAAAPDVLRRAGLPGSPVAGDAGQVAGRRLRRGRLHGVVRPLRRPPVRAGAADGGRVGEHRRQGDD